MQSLDFSSGWGANTPPPQSCGPTGTRPDSVNTENEATRGGTLGRSLKIEHGLLDSGSIKFNATDLIMIAWHYTTGQKYELITQTRILLPADIGVEPPEQPILWFSTNPWYEPSAMKPLADENGKLIRMLTLDEMYELGGGLYRFGYPISQLKCGESLRKAAKMSSIWWRRLAKKGASNLKADPANWWGHVGSLSLSEVAVEKMDDNKRWIPLATEARST